MRKIYNSNDTTNRPCNADLWCTIKKDAEFWISKKTEALKKADAKIVALYENTVTIEEEILNLHFAISKLIKDHRALVASYKSCFNSTENGQDNKKVEECYKKNRNAQAKNISDQQENIALIGSKKNDIVDLNTKIKQLKKSIGSDITSINLFQKTLADIDKACADTNPKPVCP